MTNLEKYHKVLKNNLGVTDAELNDEVLVYNVNNNMAKRRSVIEPGNWKIKQRLGNLYEIERTDKIEKPSNTASRNESLYYQGPCDP